MKLQSILSEVTTDMTGLWQPHTVTLHLHQHIYSYIHAMQFQVVFYVLLNEKDALAIYLHK